jgi:putative aldouronate transport system permease protein
MQKRFTKHLIALYSHRYYYILLLPALVYFIIFRYVPIYGLTLAFKDFKLSEGILASPWVGLLHFQRIFSSSVFKYVLKNTIIISLYRIIFAFPAPILFAIMLNEIRSIVFKRVIQSVSYLPYFISWVILAGIIIEMLSPQRGIVNHLIVLMGGKPIYFLTEPAYFRFILISTGIWQSVGWGSVIYLAAISGIDTQMLDAARIDGCTRLKMIRYITLPSIQPVIITLFVLGLGDILNAGFDQIFNLYNPLVYTVGDIIDTYVYRVGIVGAQYSFSTAVGLFKNVVGFALVVAANSSIKWMGNPEHSLW